jgi:hypothetical protein
VPLLKRARQSRAVPHESFETRTNILSLHAHDLNLINLFCTIAVLVSWVGERAEWADWKQGRPLPVAVIILSRKSAA